MSEAVTNDTGADGFETYATPIFKTKRFANVKEFVVPNGAYMKMRYGRSPGDRWTGFIDDENLRSELRDAYHKDGACLVSCDLTGAAVMLKKRKRMANDNVDTAMGGD